MALAEHAKRIRLDCEGAANHNLNRLLDKPGQTGLRFLWKYLFDRHGPQGPPTAADLLKPMWHAAMATTLRQAAQFLPDNRRIWADFARFLANASLGTPIRAALCFCGSLTSS
jgi:hypothetical protein